jgi:thiol-disulfide isomerase/thioredoxin
LPRMQKGSPPTHLIRSTNGDYLRGRVIEMDDKTLQIEVRLETKKVPRDRVAQIIWLHPDELEPSRTAANPPVAAKSEATRVQAVRSDSTRLTFFADRLADATLSGKGDVLGPCRVRLDEVDQLLLGSSIEHEASQLAYQRWKLQNAPEPIIAQSDGGSSGTESALVGKPAPDFELVLLDGKTFHLADAKGKVVVLDFWATWCGPCVQTMPQVERVAQEFQDKGVLLVAVNLQETPKEISAMLERHKLKMAVALDSDGVVADRYNATAIPQTVIINRDGTVSRLYVGGGPRFDEQLREALQGLMPGGDPKEPAK